MKIPHWTSFIVEEILEKNCSEHLHLRFYGDAVEEQIREGTESGLFGLLNWECIVMVIGDVNSDNSDNNDDTQKRNHHS